MRNKFKIMLISLMILLVGGLNAYATTGTVGFTINTSKAEVKVDDTFTVNVLVSCETGIEGLDSTLEYDNSKLELQNINVDTKFSNMSGKDETTGEYKLTVISNTIETVTQANLATIEFKVLESAKVGDNITVKISDIEVGDSEDEWFPLEDKNLTIEVVETSNEDNKPGTDDEEPGNDDNKPGTDNEEPGNDDNKPGTDDEEPGNNDNKPGVDDEEPGNDNNKPGVDDKKPSNNNPEKDTTQADKEIDKAGIENYVIIMILLFVTMGVISYKKYQKYKKI